MLFHMCCIIFTSTEEVVYLLGLCVCLSVYQQDYLKNYG